MTDPIILVRTKGEIKKIFWLSVVSLILALMAALYFPGEPIDKFVIASAESILIIHLTKLPRYWLGMKSMDIEIVSSKLSGEMLGQQTPLPFRITAVVIIVIASLYFLNAVMSIEIYKILLGSSILVVLFSGTRKVIMFNYQHGLFYGLWLTQSFYSTDRQRMKGIRFEYFENEFGIEKVKVTDKSGYYELYKKNYTSPEWERILFNLNRITQSSQSFIT
jgi:hypothetical protein